MPKNTPPFPPTGDSEHCVYVNTKIDADVMRTVIAAASLTGAYSIQEYISTKMNQVAAADLGRKPITRKPPPPKPRGKGRPPKHPKP